MTARTRESLRRSKMSAEQEQKMSKPVPVPVPTLELAPAVSVPMRPAVSAAKSAARRTLFQSPAVLAVLRSI